MRAAVPTVLVVHADARFCELMQLGLANGGYDVCVATDADDAVRQFRRHNPDLVILELDLAARAGADFVRLMKGRTAGRTVPLFIVADGPVATVLPQGVEIGAEECLTRPFSSPELLLKVKRSLERLEEHRLLQTACHELEKKLRQLEAEHELTRRELTEERSGIQAVIDFHQRIDPGLDLSDLERRGLLQTAALFQAAGSCLFRVSATDDAWVVPERWHGLVEERIRGVRLPRSGEFLRILAAERTPLRLEDFDRVPGTSWEAGILAAAGFTLVAPLLVRGDLKGILAITDRLGGQAWIASDLELLGLFCSSLALLLETAGSREADREAALAGVAVLVEELETRHPFLSGHAGRVAGLADELGSRLGLTRRDRHELRLAALLLDTGMMTMPPEMLGRAAPLTDAEWVEVRQHPALGAGLAEDAGLPESVVGGILHHHENWSGGGYPAGLRSRDIPLFARILAVAACHVAMTSDRPWRRALPAEDVATYLASESGLRFDPQVVDQLLDLVVSSPRLDRAQG